MHIDVKIAETMGQRREDAQSGSGSPKREKSLFGVEGRSAMDYVKAFLIGGLICAMVQLLMEKTKLLPGRIMVLLVVSGTVLSALGLYEPMLEFAGAGVSVPLLGFGHVLMNGVREAMAEEGPLGLFAGGFRAGAVGTSAALIFGYLASLVFRSKMKK
jgi:stage V sporulation protein AE